MTDQNFSPRIRAMALGTMGFVVTTFAIFANGGAAEAAAQTLPNHDSNAPIDVAADGFDVATRDGRATYTGNVVVRQDRLTMRAARVSVAFTTNSGVDINRVEATGGVTVNADDLNARSNVALYDLDRRLITMIGNVQLTQAGNRMSGNRLVINVGSGAANLSGGVSASGENGGRVTGRFTVPQRPEAR